MPVPVTPVGSRRPGGRRRGGLGAVVATVLLGTLAVPMMEPATAVEQPPLQQPRVSPETAAAQAAQARARATGQRQEVEVARTEYTTTYVNPSGTTTRVQSATPVRVRNGAAWADIDTNLERRPDGSFGPRAALLDVSFAGRDAQPLVRINRDAAAVSLDAPWKLPEPHIDGDTATYREVLAGVDLMMKAEAEGFREVIVIKNRAAAEHSELRQLRFALKADGVSVTETADGGLTAVDPRWRRGWWCTSVSVCSRRS